jgi:RNA polymerase sigma-70 factor (ECF subfamily)
MDRVTERDLIRSAAAGDRAAAAMLIRHHQRSVYGYILRMCGHPETAEDVVQDAFVRVLANLHRFDERFRFSTWLFTIARRVYLNQAQKLRPIFDSDTVGAAGGASGEPVDEIELDERIAVARDALQRALLRLSADQREAVVLFHQLGWPIAVVARHMDIPEGTVKSHLHRGRRRLRVLMVEEEASEERRDLIGVPQPAVSDATEREMGAR